MDEFQELLTTHQSLQKRLAEQPLSVDVEEVKSFVLRVRESGAHIRDYQQRDQLRTILRLWGAFVYERVGQYPATQLASYDRPLGPISDVITQVGAGPGWLPWVLLVLMVVVLGGVIALIYFRPAPMTQGVSSTATALAVVVSSQAPSAMPQQQESSTPPALIATIVVENATLRSAPDATGAVIGLVPRGLKLTVLARSADSAWLKVKAADETVGWITPSEIGLSSRQVAQVPQGVIAPVTPTVTPLPKPAGPTPTVTPTPQPTALYVVRVLDSQPVLDSGALRIREARNTEALLVDSAAVGEPLTVYQRVTEGNTTWLWVESPRGKRGWVRENQDGTLLVARPDQVTPTPSNTPTPKPSATLTSTRTPAETPIAALRPTPTALAVNVLAKVTPPEGAKLKVRDKPSVAGAVLGELDLGAQVVILEGPTRADGLVWWRVDNRERLAGWSAEGVGDVQYLVPVGWAR